VTGMQRQNSKHNRRGAVLIVLMVCLLLVTSMLGVMLQTAVRARRQLTVERDRRQAELLLQAGIDRAAYRLASEADYRGETWKLDSDAIVGKGAAEVTIKTVRAEEPAGWRVQVVAEYPLESHRAIRRSQTFFVQPELPTGEE